MPNTEDNKKPMLDEEYIPEKKPVTQPIAPKVTSTRKVRPLVEGINTPKNPVNVAPVVNPKFTPAENALISDAAALSSVEPEPEPEQDRLLSAGAVKRANNKNPSLGTIITVGIILLVLAFGIYRGYIWYLNRPSGVTTPINTLTYSQNTDTGLGASTTPTAVPTATSTDMTASSTFPLAGGTAPTPTPTPSVTATPTPLHQLKINSTPTGYLNVRKTPSSSGALVTQVHPGEVYAYTTTQNGWYQITLPSGQSGWVSGQYVSLQ